MLVVNNSKDNCPGQFQPRTREAFHLCCDPPTIFCLLARPVTSKLPIHLGFPSSSSSLELDWVGEAARNLLNGKRSGATPYGVLQFVQVFLRHSCILEWPAEKTTLQFCTKSPILQG